MTARISYLPRRVFRSQKTTGVASGRTGVRAKAVIPLRARHSLYRPMRTLLELCGWSLMPLRWLGKSIARRMAIFETLTPAEQARQLANPEGAVGLAVADWLNEINKQKIARSVASLGVEAGNRVLEIGFGNGRAAPEVIAQAADVQYSGIDISPTMVAEASAFNAALVHRFRGSNSYQAAWSSL